MSRSNDEIMTELGTEAVLNYERITAMLDILMDKGIMTQKEFDDKFKGLHTQFGDRIKEIFGDDVEVE